MTRHLRLGIGFALRRKVRRRPRFGGRSGAELIGQTARSGRELTPRRLCERLALVVGPPRRQSGHASTARHGALRCPQPLDEVELVPSPRGDGPGGVRSHDGSRFRGREPSVPTPLHRSEGRVLGWLRMVAYSYVAGKGRFGTGSSRHRGRAGRRRGGDTVEAWDASGFELVSAGSSGSRRRGWRARQGSSVLFGDDWGTWIRAETVTSMVGDGAAICFGDPAARSAQPPVETSAVLRATAVPLGTLPRRPS